MIRITIGFALLFASSFGGHHQTRIINGWTANQPYYKYYAFIYINNNPYCGGSIIKENMILTAASTMAGVNPSYLTVYPGMMKLQDAQYISPLTVYRVIIHPNYRAGVSDYDVAIVFLNRQMSFNDRVGKIPLSTIQYPINYIVTICGFGLADCTQKSYDPAYNAYKCTGQPSQYLRVAYMNIKQYRGNTMVTNNTFNGVVNCYGDFGGPVVYDNVLVGVQSLIQNADCTGDSYQASIPALHSWITSYM